MAEQVNEYGLMTLPEASEISLQIKAVNNFQIAVHTALVKDRDYGVIPGTDKPTLLKPGAEKITKLLGLADTYTIIDRQEDWNKPFFRYLIKCTLTSVRGGFVVSEGMGECNSYESKYRWRDAQRKCPICGQPTIFKSKQNPGWFCWAKKGGCGVQFDANEPEIINQPQGKVENEDIFSLVNTLLKMAEKRALVDAALHAGRLSDVFTQDMEDIRETVTPTSVRTVEQPAKTEVKNPPTTNNKITKAQANEIQELIKAQGNTEEAKEYAWRHYAVADAKLLTFEQATLLIDALKRGDIKKSAKSSNTDTENQEELFNN